MAGQNVYVFILRRRLVAEILTSIITSVQPARTFVRVSARKGRCNCSCNNDEGDKGGSYCFNTREIVDYPSTDDRVLFSTIDSHDFLCFTDTITRGLHSQVLYQDWRQWWWSDRRRVVCKSRYNCTYAFHQKINSELLF